MSSTNKTPNYDLSQYVGTDKPTYLGDYNGDMLKIDTQMKANNDAATDAQTSAGEAVAKVSSIENNVSAIDTRLKNTEATVQTQGQSINAISSSVSALNVDNNANKANIQGLQDEAAKNVWEKISITGDFSSGGTAYINRGLGLLNIYGECFHDGNSGRWIFGNLSNIRPSEDRRIRSGCVVTTASTGLSQITTEFTLKTTGDMVFNDGASPLPYGNYGIRCNIMLNVSDWF